MEGFLVVRRELYAAAAKPFSPVLGETGDGVADRDVVPIPREPFLSTALPYNQLVFSFIETKLFTRIPPKVLRQMRKEVENG
jgi:hypothetical protein